MASSLLSRTYVFAKESQAKASSFYNRNSGHGCLASRYIRANKKEKERERKRKREIKRKKERKKERERERERKKKKEREREKRKKARQLDRCKQG